MSSHVSAIPLLIVSPSSRRKCSLLFILSFSGIVTMVLWCNYDVKEMIGYTFHHLASIYAYYYVSVSAWLLLNVENSAAIKIIL